MLFALTAAILAGYTAEDTVIRTEGIAIMKIDKSNLQPRFDLSDAKGGASKIATKAKTVATKVISEAASKATTVADLLNSLPGEIMLGSEKICIRDKQTNCQSIPTDFNSWFPKPVRQLLAQLPEVPHISRTLTCINIRGCIIAALVTLLLSFIIMAIEFFYPSALRQQRKWYYLAAEIILLVVPFFPQIIALLAVSRISRSLEKLPFFTLNDGKLAMWLSLSSVLTLCSVTLYILQRVKATKVVMPGAVVSAKSKSDITARSATRK